MQEFEPITTKALKKRIIRSLFLAVDTGLTRGQ